MKDKGHRHYLISMAASLINMATLLMWLQTGYAGQIAITSAVQPADLVLVGEGRPTPIYMDPNENKAVRRAVRDLAEDIFRVTGKRPEVILDRPTRTEPAVIVGTLGCGLLEDLVRSGVLDLQPLRAGPEAFLIQTLTSPRALVIAGSDARGTIYGIYTLSEAIGVSPWYWWADVPIVKRPVLAVKPVRFVQGPPAVRYRGIFINDEDFGLRPWAARTFDPGLGNIGPKTYAKVFELLLRLKANLLWPAMHEGTIAFNRLPENRELAAEYGIIIGSAHCEQMLRNNVDEWHRYGKGEYNYVTNREAVLRYWQERVEEFARYEGIYTVGMRGIHDSGMPGGGTPQQQAQRLIRIIADQRQLLSRYVNSDLSKVPQIFCPYKEVLALYRLAPEIPADITICWPDDNWGYVRQFCNPKERNRPGGAGVYYHVSYWGRPYDYLWLCSTSPALIWEELTKAYDYGASRIWVINVGDIKPAEIAMEFAMELAWDPHAYGPSNISQHLLKRFNRDFGEQYGSRITQILNEYYRLCLQRKPEHMGIDPGNRYLRNPGFAVMLNGDEAQRRLDAFARLVALVEELEQTIPEQYKDAFFQLVAYPVKAAALMNEKGLCLSRFRVYLSQGRASAGTYLQQAIKAHEQIQHLTEIYNNHIAGGKWRGMMSSSPRNLPVFARPYGQVPDAPDEVILGVAVEGTDRAVLGKQPDAQLRLPPFSRLTDRRYFVDVFAAGKQPIQWAASTDQPWIRMEPQAGSSDQRIWVWMDWASAPEGRSQGTITIRCMDQEVQVFVDCLNPRKLDQIDQAHFVEDNGVIVVQAEEFSNSRPGPDASWQVIEGLGYNGKAILVQPFTTNVLTEPNVIHQSACCVEYKLWMWTEGPWHVVVRALPTFSVEAGKPQRVAVSFDQQVPVIVSFPLCLTETDPNWQQGVLQNMATAASTHQIEPAGLHTLKLWMVDPGIVVDSIVLYTGNAPNIGYTPAQTILAKQG